MEYFIQQSINGVTLGSIYGLIAIGYTMVYGIIGLVNFAHGEVFMISAFIALITYLLLQTLGITFIPLALLIMMVLAMVLTSFFAYTMEKLAYKPLRNSFRIAPLISAIGVSMFLMNLVQVSQGARNKAIPPLVDQVYIIMRNDNGFEVTVALKQILIILCTICILAAFTYLVSKTSLGRAQRATAQDRKMAALLGVNIDRTITITFIIGACLASVAGTMYLTNYGVVTFSDGFVPGIKAFTAAVLGGIGSLPGAMIGGILIGLIETYWSAYFSVEYKDVAAFSILAIVLIFMPQGIMGKPDVEKV